MLMRYIGFVVVLAVVWTGMAEELSAEARAKALMTAEVRPEAYVFTGDKFPLFDFEDPALGERLLGKYAISVRFFDAKATEIRTPVAAGRVGAVVEISGAEGAVIRRFRTLFRAGEGYDAKLQAYWGPTKAMYFGKRVSVPRDAWLTWPTSGPRFIVAEAQYHTRDGQDLAILAAGAGDLSKDPWLADRQWWVDLKRKLAGMDTAPVKVPGPSGAAAPMLREGTVIEAGMAPDAADKLDALLAEWATASGEPFAVALARRGVVFLHRSYGFRDGTPLTVDSPSWMASISKLMSSTLMWMLVDRGLVSLDDPIEKYLPALAGKAGEDVVHVRDCYTHTNGLSLDIVLPGHYPNHWGDELHDLDEVLAGYYPLLKIAPEPTYNGVGYAVGGKIVEMVSGEALPTFYQRHLLDPLGMTNTQVQDGGAATRSVPMDMAKLGQMLLNKGAYGDTRFFSEETFAKMLPKRLTETLGEETKAVWGIGITPMPAEGLSDKTFGHGAASAAIFRIDPEQDLVLVQCRDTGGAGYEEFSKRFYKLVGELVVK
jgi:CubicO group peptidase (beta-lactamase class C family)